MHSIDQFVQTATRQFTDRQKPRALFEKTIKNLHKTTCISYYGMGGIGKTRLLTTLMQEATVHTEQPVRIFVNFGESAFRNIGELLNILKLQLLEEDRIDFYNFELAYSVYWAKTQPGDVPLQKSKTFISENHVLFDIIDNLDGIPYANLIPRAINLMSKIPQHTKKAKWWKESGNTLAAQLQYIDDVQMLRDILLDLWVNDVTNYYKHTGRKIIFFFDSFECVDLTKLPRVKTLMYKFPTFPVLFIVGSRNKLQWDSNEQLLVDEHIVGELSEADIRSFLKACRIGCSGEQCHCQTSDSDCEALHEAIIQKIIQVSNGIPGYLDLMVDTYIQITKEQQPLPEHFTQNQHEIVPLLLDHFKESELAFLELMSFPNYWNYALVKDLFNHFNPGIRLSSVTQFYVYSFIDAHNEQHITMQAFIRKWLQQQLRQNATHYYEDVHTHLFSYYEALFNQDGSYHNFLEAAYHGQRGLAQQPFEQWLQQSLNMLFNQGYHEDLIPFLQTLLASYKFSKEADALLHVMLLTSELKLGQYTSIIEKATSVIDKANDVERDDFRTKVQYILGASYYAMSEYEEAIKYFKLACTGQTNILQAIDAHMKIGKISVTISDFETARQYYLEASQQIHRLLQQQQDATLFSLAGQCFEKLGELMAYNKLYSEQLRLYKQSIHYLQLAVQDEQHPNYLQHVTLLGFSTKRLAEAHEVLHEDAAATFNEAIAYYKKVLDVIPHDVDTLEKLGHASTDLMRVARNNNDTAQFEAAFNDAHEAFTTVVRIAPTQGSSLNRLSSIMLKMAHFHMDIQNDTQAYDYLQKAQYYYDQTITNAPNYAYAPAKKKELEKAFGRFEAGNQ